MPDVSNERKKKFEKVTAVQKTEKIEGKNTKLVKQNTILKGKLTKAEKKNKELTSTNKSLVGQAAGQKKQIAELKAEIETLQASSK